MKNFTVGPVHSFDCSLEIGGLDTPYFRTPEFSEVVLECESTLLQMLNAPATSRVVLLTGSGTAGMESSVINTLTSDDKVLVVEGGGFGRRFCELCALHGIPYEPIKLEFGEALKEEDLLPYEGKGYTAFLVNIHETSTGVLYDSQLIGDFCRRNNLFLIVDAISSFLADPFDMSSMGANVVIAGSQKALACPPGVCVVCLDPVALDRVASTPMKCMYMDYGLLLKNGERGQTPFTPAVNTILQIHARLKQIIESGGVACEVQRVNQLAQDFRSRIEGLPLAPALSSPSNAITFVWTQGCSAKMLFQTLKDEYGIWVCPNGGNHADDSFRVGHIGNLTEEDNVLLVEALNDLAKRGILR